MSTTLTQRQLSATFEYGTGDNGLGPPETLQLDNLRIGARVCVNGGAGMSDMQLRIYGMTLSQMNQLSTLGAQINLTRRNIVTLSAGDTTTGMSQLYKGTIYSAWCDMQSSPQVCFNVMALGGLVEQMQPAPAVSYPGSYSVAVAMQGFAIQMGLDFINHGVDATLPPTYFPGTAREQAARCANAAGIDWIIDNGVLAIWPKGGTRGDTGVTLTPTTGMAGYPQFTAQGIIVKALFNKAFKFGATVTVEGSILKQANGKWKCVQLAHDLASLTPGGPWFTEMMVVNPAFVVTPG